MMRRCGRAEELRQALAAEKPMSASLAAHVGACSECARMGAAARRFDDRLEAAMAELVTDALPTSTVTVARMGPLHDAVEANEGVTDMGRQGLVESIALPWSGHLRSKAC